MELLPKRLDECICENVGGHQEFRKIPHSNVSVAACADVDANRTDRSVLLMCSVFVVTAMDSSVSVYDT